MTATFRDRLINTTIASVGSLIVALSVSYIAYNRDGNITISKDLEVLKKTKADKAELVEKLDKDEFNRYKKEQALIRKQERDEMKEYFDTRFEDLKDFIKLYNQ